jgi:hypothetical protein
VEVPSRFEISDELWAEVEPLIPARPRRRRYPSATGAVAACDCDREVDGNVPIIVVDWEDYQGPPPPSARSFHDMIEDWIRAFDAGLWEWDREARRWGRGSGSTFGSDFV